MADRSVKTLPKRIKNISLDVSKQASKRISPDMFGGRDENEEYEHRVKDITA